MSTNFPVPIFVIVCPIIGVILSTMEFQSMAHTCHGTVSMKLGQACLHVKNVDDTAIIELWGQSQECYMCSLWKYLSVPPGHNESLLMNTTYTTDLYFTSEGRGFHKLSYHFGEYGNYNLQVNRSDLSDMDIVTDPVHEYSALAVVVASGLSLLVFWHLCDWLLNKFRSSFYITDIGPTEATIDEDRNVLLGQEQIDESYNVSSEQNPVVEDAVIDNTFVRSRLGSLDAFRGLSIILMIFVNYGGGKYSIFRHSRWNGLTFADLVFPWFMWIMGVSLSLSINSQLRRGGRRFFVVTRIFKRTLILFALGIVLNSMGSNNLKTLRIPGVLQRFGVCYLVNALMEVCFMQPDEQLSRFTIVSDLTISWMQWSITLVSIVLHTLVIALLPVPGCPIGYFGPGGIHGRGLYSNCTGGASGYVDRLVFGQKHLYKWASCREIYDCQLPFDPEGLLGILTSCFLVQQGVAAGRILLSYRSHMSRISRWTIWAIITGLIGGILCGWEKEGGLIPVNKNLWSTSYVLVTGSLSFLLLIGLYLLVDVKNWWSGNPLGFVGQNAILLYVGHELCHRLFPWSWSPVGDYHGDYLFMNLWGTTLWILIAYWCHKNKFYITL